MSYLNPAAAGYARARSLWASLRAGGTLVRAIDLNRWDAAVYELKTAVFNVQDFGAVPNDSTAATANSAAITNAISALQTAGGGTLYFGVGTWWVGSTISLPDTNSGIKGAMRGVGHASTVIKPANSTNLAKIIDSPGAYWELCHFGVDGNKANQASGGIGVAVGSPRQHVHHLHIQSCKSDGIRSTPSGNNTQSHANLYSNIYIISCDGDGFSLVGSQTPDNQITNLWIGSSAGRGVYVESSANRFANVHSWGNTGFGFYINGGSTNMVTNGYFETNSSSGYVVTGGGGNRLVNSQVWKNSLHGVNWSVSTRNSVENSVIHENSGTGVLVGSSSYCQVVGCQMYSPFAYPSANQDYAIQSTGSSDNLVAVGNVMRGADHQNNLAVLLVGSSNILADNLGYKTVNAGTSTSTPGAVSSVTIAHGLDATPVGYAVTAANSNARGAPSLYATVDATNITLTFSSALTGATSYAWAWTARS